MYTEAVRYSNTPPLYLLSIFTGGMYLRRLAPAKAVLLASWNQHSSYGVVSKTVVTVTDTCLMQHLSQGRHLEKV